MKAVVQDAVRQPPVRGAAGALTASTAGMAAGAAAAMAAAVGVWGIDWATAWGWLFTIVPPRTSIWATNLFACKLTLVLLIRAVTVIGALVALLPFIETWTDGWPHKARDMGAASGLVAVIFAGGCLMLLCVQSVFAGLGA